MSFSADVTAILGLECDSSYGVVAVDVPREQWTGAVTRVRDALGLSFFDLLTAVDEGAAGFDVVVRLWSPQTRNALLLRTRCPRDDAVVPSLTTVFGGAAWHERHVREMFGIAFAGHPSPEPLLLPDGFAGHPLRKEFVLAARVAKEWPGAREPGEGHGGAPRRRRMRPLGVPEPGKWGPDDE